MNATHTIVPTLRRPLVAILACFLFGFTQSSPLVAQGKADANESSEKTTEAEGDTLKLPAILVKGEKTINVDVLRTRDDPQPYVVFDHNTLEQSGATNLDDFFRTRLPMNTTFQSVNQVANTTSANSSSVNLRGLGANQTLILLDGRRLPSRYFGGPLGQSDINGIPMSFVERIEVLPATASGVFGGGATGGVINIITRKNYSGADLRATYGSSSRGDAANYRFDLSAGYAAKNGFSIRIAASYQEVDPILVGDRDFAARGRALQFRNNPSAFFSLATPPEGYTSNIRSQNGSNLILKNGTALNSPFTFVPVGYGGVSGDVGAALIANAGQYNLQLPDSINGIRQSVLSGSTVDSESIDVRREFGERVEGFASITRRVNRGKAIVAGGIPAAVTLQPAAVNNPFTTPIVVSFPATTLWSLPGIGTESRAEELNLTSGVIVRLPHEWTASIEYNWSRSSVQSSFSNPVIGDPDGAGPGVSGATAVANSTLDVMRDLNAFPLDWSPYLLPIPNDYFMPFVLNLNNPSLRLSGPLLQLPGGKLTFSSMIESLDQKVDQAFEIATAGYRVFPGRSQNTKSYNFQVSAPLFSHANARPLIEGLELQAAVRGDSYETRTPSLGSVTILTSGGSALPLISYNSQGSSRTTYSLGLSYTPVKDLMLRVSNATGFLPPQSNQLIPSTGVSAVTFLDPKRGNASTTTNFPYKLGGNLNLAPEDSESFSVGAVFTPRFVRGLRLSIDYIRIKKTNEIFTLGLQDAVNAEDILAPSSVTRAPLTPADAALGYTGGVINGLDLSTRNVSGTNVEAYDFQLNYRFETQVAGDFELYAIATRQTKFERQLVAGMPFVDAVGFSSAILKWSGNAGLKWEKGPWTVDWNVQYYDSYLSYVSSATPAQITVATLNQGSSTIPSQSYHDVSATYRFGHSRTSFNGLLKNMEVSCLIQNVWDKSPPILATTAPIGGYSFYGDPRLRRFSFVVKKKF